MSNRRPEHSAVSRLLDAGYDDVVIFENYSYDDALIGVTSDNRAVYDYDLMVDWLRREEAISAADAAEWIEYNTIQSLPYMDDAAPIIVYRL